MEKEVLITTPYITLAQLLKMEDVIASVGQAKWYLREKTVYYNDEPENRRGKKLYDGDVVRVPDFGTFLIKSKQEIK